MEAPDWSKGLVPAIAQDFATGEVLMMAYMNEAAWQETLRTGRACYWSRSREKLWRKGEESGHHQEVREIRIDCDRDTIVMRVVQHGGAACHIGYRSCFYRRLDGNQWTIDDARVFDPADVYEKKK
ncbi:MAG: phosphoribosyl-AMP cyclohydrolase [Deltaproteobacteria bacterium]